MFIAPFLVPRLDDRDRAPDPRRGGTRGGPRGPRFRDARPRPEGRGVREGLRQRPRPKARNRRDQRHRGPPRRPARPRHRSGPGGRDPAPDVLRDRVDGPPVRREARLRRHRPVVVQHGPREGRFRHHAQDRGRHARPPVRPDRRDGLHPRRRPGPRHPPHRGRRPGRRRGVPRQEGGQPRRHGVLLLLRDEEHDDRRGRHDRHRRRPHRRKSPAPPASRPADEVRARPRRFQLSDDGNRGRDRPRAAREARRLGEASARERARAVQGPRRHRGARPALRRQLDGPFVLPIHRAAGGAVPAVPGRDRPGPDRGWDRLSAVISDAALQTEGPAGPEDPRSMSRRRGSDPGAVRAPGPPRRRPGRSRAHRRGGRGTRADGLELPGTQRPKGLGPVVWPAMDLHAFQAALHDGVEKERALRWAEAADLYETLARASSDPAMRALALLRQGNALMELRRWDDARTALDAGLHEAKASGEPGLLGQALLAAGVFAANRDDPNRAEAFLLDALERFHRKDDRAHLQGRGWAFLNLASLYGKTGRLDLAFVTFTKAQDVLGAAEDWAGVAAAWEAQAQLRRAIHDEDRWREDLAEAVVFYDREGMAAKAGRLRALLGKKVV